MQINVKKKFTAVVDHVKAHPIAYSVALGAAVTTIARYAYDSKKGLIYLEDAAKHMTETGKKLCYHNTKTGTTILTMIYDPETMPNVKFFD